MEYLISDAPFPGREEVEGILSAYASPKRSLKDEKRFQSLECAWKEPGALLKWTCSFLDDLDGSFNGHILARGSAPPFPNHLLEEGVGSINALRGLWTKQKGIYYEDLQKKLVCEQHRLKERDIMSGRVVEKDDAVPPSSLQLGADNSYLVGMDGRLAFYFGHPEWISLPLPTSSMIEFLDASFSQSSGAIEEVR